MARPTLPLLSEAAAEALAGTVDVDTGAKIVASLADANSSPTLLAQLNNYWRQTHNLLGNNVQGLVVDLVNGLTVGVYPLQYRLGNTSYAYVGDAIKTLSASKTSYLYVDSAKTLKVDETGWPTGDHIKLGIVVTNTTNVTAMLDSRFENMDPAATANWWTFKPTADVDMDGKGMNNLGPLAAKDWSALTIAVGVVTPTQLLHTIDTEASAATDDLDTITAVAGAANRRFLVLKLVNSARVVTLKNGTGNLVLGADVTLSSTSDSVTLLQTSDTQWTMISNEASTPTALTQDLSIAGFAAKLFGPVTLTQSELAISSGAISPTGSLHTVVSEGMAPTDELTDINRDATKGPDLLILTNSTLPIGMLITVKFDVNKIMLANGKDYVMDFPGKTLTLAWNKSMLNWVEIARSRYQLADLVNTGEAIPYTITINIPGALTVKTYEQHVYLPIGFTMKDATGVVATAPTGATLIVDILDDGLSVFASQAEMINVLAGATQGTSTTKNHVWAAGSIAKIQVEQIGSTVAGSDLTVTLNGFIAAQTPPT